MATSVDTLAANTPNRGNILRAKRAAVFVAPMSTEVPTTLTTAGSGGAAPTLTELAGFEPIGLINKDDAISRTRDREVSDIMAVGYQDPVRSDVTSDVFSVSIVALETRKTTIEKFLQVDLSGVTIGASGELSFPQPNDGLLEQSRWLFICQDGTADNRTYWGWCFTAGIVSEVDDQAAGTDDDGFYWPMTIAAQTDTTLGYSVRHYFAGGGWLDRVEGMGFEVTP